MAIRTARRLCRSWTGVQAASHVAVTYAICCFAVLIHPDWHAAGDGKAQLLRIFWVVFSITLGLYLFVCFADTSYQQKTLSDDECEPRQCEECSCDITDVRVKHCYPCGKCICGFDHHCRYLNVCIGNRTYAPWFAFVAGLLTLMVVCTYAAFITLAHGPDLVEMDSSHAALVLLGMLSLIASIFLLCLLFQHVYFIYGGLTTLEYIKDQSAGFPGLPPDGWRHSVQAGECFSCRENLELAQSEDPEELWFCSICQSDLGKAGVEFYVCSCCGEINVCLPCRRIAEQPDEPVITRKVTSLRRKAIASRGDNLPIHSRTASNVSFLSAHSMRHPRTSARTLSNAVAAVEGSTGDDERAGCTICAWEKDSESEDNVGDEEADGDGME